MVDQKGREMHHRVYSFLCLLSEFVIAGDSCSALGYLAQVVLAKF